MSDPLTVATQQRKAAETAREQVLANAEAATKLALDALVNYTSSSVTPGAASTARFEELKQNCTWNSSALVFSLACRLYLMHACF